MKKLMFTMLLLSTFLLIMGCRSKTGRQNIQYVRPVEDTAAHNDFEEDDEWKETPIIDVGKTPEQEDFDRLRDDKTNDELERMLQGK
jgi:GH25 family lysozyme M1 (1,4-beta-N-acetylmuramidase)